MKSRFIPVLLAGAIAVLPSTAGAHHSFSAEYDAEKVMNLVGVITKIDQQNPHGFFYMDVKSATNGRVTNWALETPGPNQLVQTGFTKVYQEIVEKKEMVTVKAYPAKDGAKRAFAETVTRADGRTVITISTGGVSGAVGRAAPGIIVDGVQQDTGGGRGGATRGGGGRGGPGGGAPGGGGGGAPRGGGGPGGAGGGARGAAPAPGGN